MARGLSFIVIASIAALMPCAACGSSSSDGPNGGTGGTTATGAGGATGTGAGTSGGAKGTGAKGSTGATSGGGAAGSESAGVVACSSEPTHTGQATYYTFADGSGNCSFDKSPNDLMIGAMNATDYAGSAACGGCVTIHGPNGDLSIRIVDQCPDCAAGNIDLSPTAFDKIAARSAGRVPMTWEYAACTEAGPVGYRFKDGSNAYWTAVQVLHHKNRIAKFEVQKSGAFVEVPRETYNYFVDASGMGPGPYTFRITDVYGNTLTDTGIKLDASASAPGPEEPGAAQFPDCK